jgi:ketosteroid isomerase-like protein
MNLLKTAGAAAICGMCASLSGVAVQAQEATLQAASAEIVKADAAFAQSVADKNRERFLSFIADAATFNGGTPNELHGRDAVMKAWGDFFEPNGPTLTWSPTKGEVVGAGDVGYTTGRSVLRLTGAEGKITERRGQYVTIWRKQADGSWKVVFDTGSTLPQ